MGLILRHQRVLPEQSAGVLNVLILWIALPAVILLQLPALLTETKLTPELLIPASMAWIQFFLSSILIWLVARSQNWNRATTGALILTAGLGNTSFVGFPVLEALYGEKSLRIGLIVDQVGSFLVISLPGIALASMYSGRRPHLGQMLRRIAIFPPFIAVGLAIALTPWRATVVEPLRPALEKLGGTLVPMALISVGTQLHLDRARIWQKRKPLAFGLSLKLILLPALLSLFYLGAIGARGEISRITIMEAAMAPMITAAIVVSEFRLDSDLANLMVGLGIPISLFTLAGWYWVLEWF
ncbi:MAG: AEC family transporter [Bdellovibrionales bacterium]